MPVVSAVVMVRYYLAILSSHGRFTVIVAVMIVVFQEVIVQ